MVPFTVFIPTFNRCDTLPHTLESCLAQEDDGLRIIVSDNFSTDATRDVVESFRKRDARVSYIQPPRRMGLGTHWEFGLSSLAPGGFAMLLGSDDALLPGCMTRARACLAAHPQIEVLTSYPCPAYYYPDSGTANAGQLYVTLEPRHELRNSQEWLTKVALGEAEITQLPFVYQQGWVKTDVFQRIIKTTGRLVHSLMPDLFLAVAVASVTEQYLSISPGFGMGGYSATSNGSATTQPEGNRSLETTFMDENEIPFHPSVNYSRSLPVLVGEVLLQARDKNLLPPGIPIVWDRFIARAWLECHIWPWPENQRADNIAALRQLAKTMGVESVLEDAAAYPDMTQWEAATPWLRNWPVYQFDTVVDTRPFRVNGSHEAARLAEQLMGTTGSIAERLAATPLGIAPFDTNALSKIAIHQAAKCAELQHELTQVRRALTDVRAESARRGQERDRAKAKIIDLKAQLEKKKAVVP